MADNNQIEIPLNKGKLTKFLVFSVLFLIAGIWMIITNPEISNPVFNNPVFKIIASYGGTLMGAIGIYYFTKKLFGKEPGLVLSDQGIYDGATAFKFGLIPWSDISEIYGNSIQVSMASKQHFVTIGLIDPDKYILREKSFFKRKLLLANLNSYGSPVHISTNGLMIEDGELLQVIVDAFEKYKLQRDAGVSEVK